MHHVSPVPGRTRPLLPAAVLLLTLCLLVSGAQALIVPMDDATLAKGADEVVRGEITDVHAGWTADHTSILTTVTVQVHGRVKGQGPDTLTLTSLGGTVDDVTQWVEDEPVLVPGTEAFIFVKHGANGDRVYGGPHGIVPVGRGRVHGNGKAKGGGVSADAYGQYIGDLAAGRAVAAPVPEPAPRAAAGPSPVIPNVSPSTASAGTGSEITITGTGFGMKASRESYADVGFTYRYDGAAVTPIWASGYPYYLANEDSIVSWSDTAIVVRIPTGTTADYYDGTASSGYLWVLTDENRASETSPFTVSFAYGAATWADAPVPYYINPDGFAAGLTDGVRNASGTWNAAVNDTQFRIAYAGSTSATTLGGEVQNLIRMGTPAEFYSGGPYAYSSNSYSEGRMLNCVIVFNPYYTWTAGYAGPGQVNIEKVALHELGHWLRLKDLYGWVPGYPSDEGKVMFGYGSYFLGNLNQRILQPDDVAGIRWCYAGGTPPPVTPPVTPTPRPYPGPHAVPGRIQTEDFDTGGEGVAYHDTEAANLGNSNYRSSEGVDIETGNGITDVGWVRSGEWLTYTVNATTSQSVVLELRASRADAGATSVGINLSNGDRVPMYIESTGSFDTFATFASGPFWLLKGETTIRLQLPNRINLDYLEIVPAVLPTTTITKLPTPTPVVPQPYPGPHIVPGTVEAEDFDAGGEGVGYHDYEPVNLGNSNYRAGEGVDIETGIGITDVGWVRDGEWLSYTVNAATPQVMVLRLRASNPDTVEKPITIFRNGLFVAMVRVPPTGSLTNFTIVYSTPFSLEGENAVRLASFEGGVERVNFDRLEFEPAPPEVSAVPGGMGVPTDTNTDRLYDDVNGNGRRDFADVVLFFNQMTWIAANEPVSAFDYNMNGRIDFADVVWLFNHL